MTDQDRGAYTPPTDAPLSFDARQPVRGSRPVPITLIISAFVLILLVVAIVVFYRSGVRQAGQAPQAVGTPVGAIKSPAPADAQPVDPAAGLQIYKSEGGDAATAPAPTFTAPPEQPQARPEPAPPAAAPTAAVASAQPLPPPKAAASVGLKPAQAAPPPAAKPAPAPLPKALPPAPAVRTPPPAPKPAPAATAGGSFGVQIGAFSSQAQADDGFRAAAAISPSAVTGKGKRVEPVQKGAATLYRTTVTGFGSRADAQAFCNQLKAAGKSCFVK